MQVKIVNGDVEALASMLNQAIADAYEKGQQAERERIRARAKLAAERTWRAGGCYVGPQNYIIEKFVETLLEDGDE